MHPGITSPRPSVRIPADHNAALHVAAVYSNHPCLHLAISEKHGIPHFGTFSKIGQVYDTLVASPSELLRSKHDLSALF